MDGMAPQADPAIAKLVLARFAVRESVESAVPLRLAVRPQLTVPQHADDVCQPSEISIQYDVYAVHTPYSVLRTASVQ